MLDELRILIALLLHLWLSCGKGWLVKMFQQYRHRMLRIYHTYALFTQQSVLCLKLKALGLLTDFVLESLRHVRLLILLRVRRWLLNEFDRVVGYLCRPRLYYLGR